jgi:predicted metal-binding membrane protein
MVAVLALGVVAWIATILWAFDMGMGAEPGTMGLGLPAFVGIWTVMMAAMMLPAVSPLVSLYARTVRGEPARLTMFGLGYVFAWASTGLIAYAVATAFDRLAEERPRVAQAIGVAAFSVCGIYQLTPMKRWCLRHCRSPLGHLLHYASYGGRTRDVRAGLHHGLVCIGCCWMLMVALVAVGVMNIPAMVGLALLIALEKQWRFGETLAKVAGVAALVYAAAIAVDADFAPGLVHTDEPMDMSGVEMEVPATGSGRHDGPTGIVSDGLKIRHSEQHGETAAGVGT